MITASSDNTVAMVKCKGGAYKGLVRKYQGHTSAVTACAFRFQSNLNAPELIMSASLDGTAKLWATECGDCLMTLVHRCAVYAAGFDHPGELLATAGEDGVVRLWDMNVVEPHLINRSADRFVECIEVPAHGD